MIRPLDSLLAAGLVMRHPERSAPKLRSDCAFIGMFGIKCFAAFGTTTPDVVAMDIRKVGIVQGAHAQYALAPEIS